MIKLDLKSEEKYDEEQEQENLVRHISNISKEYFCFIFYSSSG